MHSYKKLLLAFPSFLLLHSSAHAADLVVRDCGGKTRLAQQIGDNEKGSLIVNVVDLQGRPASGIASKLSAGPETPALNATATEGTMVFDGVKAGSYKLCAGENTEASFSKIAFKTEASNSMSVGQVALLGAGSIAGLVAGIAEAQDGSTGGSTSTSISSSGTGVTEEIRSSHSTPRSTSRRSAAARRPRANATCYVGDDVAPISPIS